MVRSTAVAARGAAPRGSELAAVRTGSRSAWVPLAGAGACPCRAGPRRRRPTRASVGPLAPEPGGVASFGWRGEPLPLAPDTIATAPSSSTRCGHSGVGSTKRIVGYDATRCLFVLTTGALTHWLLLDVDTILSSP
ncbi:hypothetical protein U9M48_022976 [Paspalum notatum var. saurae]|uniref:Uncharacterized protein n=1 Tax=Paspalum notatum var. saurae TaxID=547442 RepID=A0AAQ3TPC1_PASNO